MFQVNGGRSWSVHEIRTRKVQTEIRSGGLGLVLSVVVLAKLPKMERQPPASAVTGPARSELTKAPDGAASLEMKW